MAGLRFADLQSRPMEFLDLTSVTLDEFQQLVPPFEAAFQAHMAAWRMDGKPRTVPPVYRISELPSADARRSALVYSHLSQDLRPPGDARALVRDGPGQSPSVDPRALARAAGRAACPRRCPGPLPARSRPALAQRLGVSEAEAATVVVPREEAPATGVTGPAAASASPLLPMKGSGQNDVKMHAKAEASIFQ